MRRWRGKHKVITGIRGHVLIRNDVQRGDHEFVRRMIFKYQFAVSSIVKAAQRTVQTRFRPIRMVSYLRRSRCLERELEWRTCLRSMRGCFYVFLYSFYSSRVKAYVSQVYEAAVRFRMCVLNVQTRTRVTLLQGPRVNSAF